MNEVIDGKAEVVASENELEQKYARLQDIHASINALVKGASEQAIWFGLVALEIKAQVNHGEFGKRLRGMFPKTPSSTMGYWMKAARNILKTSKLQISNSWKFDRLSLPADSLSQQEVEVKEKITAVIRGKSLRDLVSMFPGEMDDAPPELPPAPKGGNHHKYDENGEPADPPRKTSTPAEMALVATTRLNLIANDIADICSNYPQYFAICDTAAFDNLDRQRKLLSDAMRQVNREEA